MNREPDGAGAILAAVHSFQAEVAEMRTDIETLPERFALRAEVDAKWAKAKRRARAAAVLVVVLVVAGVLSVFRAQVIEASARDRDEAVRKNACILKGILDQAQSSANRNPVPPGIDDATREFVERARAQSAEFYRRALDDLNDTLAELKGSCPPSPAVGV